MWKRKHWPGRCPHCLVSHGTASRFGRLAPCPPRKARGQAPGYSVKYSFPTSSPAPTRNRRSAAEFPVRISPRALMTRIATGLVWMRNSSCSSASRRAATSFSTLWRFSRSCWRCTTTSREYNPIPASATKSKMSCGKDVAGLKHERVKKFGKNGAKNCRQGDLPAIEERSRPAAWGIRRESRSRH